MNIKALLTSIQISDLSNIIFLRSSNINVQQILNSISTWFMRIKSKTTKFIYVLILAFLALFLAINYSFNSYILILLVIIIFTIVLSMIVMLLTDNKIFSLIKNQVWGNTAIWVFITIYSAVSYIWASGEVNRIFSVAPNNFTWTLTFLTAVHFLRYIILFVLLLFLVALIIYLYIWLFKNSILPIKENKSLFYFLKDFVFMLILIFILTFLISIPLIIEQNFDHIVHNVAIKADFSQYHSCQGNIFNDIEGIMFLSQDYVLLAKKNGAEGLIFLKEKCL